MGSDEPSLEQMDAVVRIVEGISRDDGDRVRVLLRGSVVPLVTCGERGGRCRACAAAPRGHRPGGRTWTCYEHSLCGVALDVSDRLLLLGVSDLENMEAFRQRLAEAARAIRRVLGEPGGAPAPAWAGLAGRTGGRADDRRS